MLKKTFLLLSILLSACTQVQEPVSQNECLRIMGDSFFSLDLSNETHKEMFGTPENKGPCWGRTTGVHQFGTLRTFSIALPVPGYVFATITYEGNKMVQVGLGRV
jgi:hypothetical protein